MHSAISSAYGRCRQRAWDVRRDIPASPEVDHGGKGTRPERSAQVSLRLSEAKKGIIEESLRHSTYRDISAFLRNVSTGWDPRAPIAAKAGITLCWTGAHLGTEVGTQEWEELERLFNALLGIRSLEGGLRLAEKHLLAALAAEADISLESSTLGLIGRRGAGRETRRRLAREEGQSCTATFKISRKRLALIDRAAEQEGYDNRSAYVRAVALCQDRFYEVFARGAVILFWARSHAREEIGTTEWVRLDGLMREHLGTYLFPSRCLPSKGSRSAGLSRDFGDDSVDDSSSDDSFLISRSLWRAGAQLLAANPDSISTETGLSFH